MMFQRDEALKTQSSIPFRLVRLFLTCLFVLDRRYLIYEQKEESNIQQPPAASIECLLYMIVSSDIPHSLTTSNQFSSSCIRHREILSPSSCSSTSIPSASPPDPDCKADSAFSCASFKGPKYLSSAMAIIPDGTTCL